MGPEIAATDWTNCSAHRWIRCGFARSGKQQWRCAICGKYFTEGRVNRVPEESMRDIAPLFKTGTSIRGTARVTGIERKQVVKYFRKFRAFLESRHGQTGR